MSRAPRLTAAADAVLGRVALLKNPYFTALADGTMPLPQFRASQEQFFFAVRYFPRPIAALAARIPDPALRLDLLRNLVEEHGEFREEQFHQNTFRNFLASIGARCPDAAAVPMGSVVHAFNSILMSACASDDVEVGVGCLGIIERAFADISVFIGGAVVRRGWVGVSDLAHYALHAQLDVQHADGFFAIVESRWDNSPARVAIEQGLELGAYAFDQLYRGLILQG